ncbi:hypothetical protein NDN08_007828 [Rhodosorus marinus]|uniref:Uncharacterized protein n=1 Tax=Rhodosorus marinus TaxID=101924 RepID=A0AAV8V3D1_9RHOD|nr:hypothetical protein NDN08_007828 [Rhodosorus marinus]
MDVLPAHFLDMLSGIWGETGKEKAEREEFLRETGDSVLQILASRVNSQKLLAEQLRRERDELVQDIEVLCSDVGGTPMDASILEGLASSAQVAKLKRERGSLLDEQKRMKSDAAKIRDSIVSVWVDTLGEPYENLSILTCSKSCFLEKVLHAEELQVSSIAAKRKVKVEALLTKISDLLKTLGREPRNSQHAVDQALILGSSSRLDRTWMETVEARLKEVEEEENRRRVELAELVKIAFDLYKSLDLPSEQSAKFMEANSNVSDDSMNAWRFEIARLQEVRNQRIENSVRSRLSLLESLWNELGVLEEQRGSYTFVPGNIEAQDEVARRLREELTRLETGQSLVEPLRELLSRRSDLRIKRLALDLEAENPKRLLERKPSEAGKLLREEKLRREISALPRIDAMALKGLAEYKNKTGVDFVWDRNVAETLVRQEQHADELVREEKRLKRITTRSNNRHGLRTTSGMENGNRSKNIVSISLKTPTSIRRGTFRAATESSARKRTSPRRSGRKDSIEESSSKSTAKRLSISGENLLKEFSKQENAPNRLPSESSSEVKDSR